jgi:hypothetical protein
MINEHGIRVDIRPRLGVIRRKKYDIEEEAERGVWTTKDGREIPVEEMTTSHIQNTIALLERNNCDDMYTPWITVFHKELQRR